jgi:hypothetical protein
MNRKTKETDYELCNVKAKANTDMGWAISIWVCVAYTCGMLG